MTANKTRNEYTFYGRLSADFPSQINVDITEVCNLKCIHCPHPMFKNSEHYAARYLPVELNEKMVDEIRESGGGKMQYIRYSSEGEPLIHPHAYTMIENAVKHSGVFVTLTTNGTIMNEKRTQRLLEAGVHMIDISIDAFREDTYSRIRINGDLQVTRNNVLNLIRWTKETGSNTKIVVSFVEQGENSGEVYDFRNYWESKGADYVIIRRLHSASGAIGNSTCNTGTDTGFPDRRPCLYPWERIVLNPRGFLSFCPTDWVNKSSVADFRTTTIKEAWQGNYYKALRKAHVKGEFHNHAFCGQCPDWRHTRWPEEGRSYADLIQELKT